MRNHEKPILIVDRREKSNIIISSDKETTTAQKRRDWLAQLDFNMANCRCVRKIFNEETRHNKILERVRTGYESGGLKTSYVVIQQQYAI